MKVIRVIKDVFNPEQRRRWCCIGVMMYLLGIIASPIMCLLMDKSITFYDVGVFISYMTLTYSIYLLLVIAIEYVLFPKSKV